MNRPDLLAATLLDIAALGKPGPRPACPGPLEAPATSRSASASERVGELARGAEIIAQSPAHPDLDPAKGGGLAPIARHLSDATDPGAMAQRAGARYLMFTHLGPATGPTTQGPFPLRGDVMAEARRRDAAMAGGFAGEIVIGQDPSSVRLPLV